MEKSSDPSTRCHSQPPQSTEPGPSNREVQKSGVAEGTWIYARPTTDHDLESQRHERVNACPCARRTTDRDLVSQRHEKENACPRARRTTDRDLISVVPNKKKEKER